jgi:hypothetical protein
MVNYELVLDPAIRNWVVLPMIILMTFMGIGRSYGQQLMKSEPKITQTEFDEIRYKQTIGRAERLRVMGQVINKRAFNTRKTYLHNPKQKGAAVTNGDAANSKDASKEEDPTYVKGLLQETVPGATNPMMGGDPSAMVGMLKGNAIYMIPNMGMMWLTNFFFQGFVCLKVPFSMPSEHFKSMLQRGVDISTLDVSYVSSLSWYILLTFGLTGVYRLILDEGLELDEGKMMQAQMQMGVGGMGFDASAGYKSARENLKVTKNNFLDVASAAEKKLLGKNYPSDAANAAEDTVDLSSFNVGSVD